MTNSIYCEKPDFKYKITLFLMKYLTE